MSAAVTRRARLALASTATWSSAGSTAGWWRPVLFRSGRAIGSRPPRAPRAGSRGCSPAGCSSRLRPGARAGGRPRSRPRPRGRAPRPHARPPPAVEVLPPTRPAAAGQVLGQRSPQVAVRAAVRLRRPAAGLRYLRARARPRRLPDRGARAFDPGDGRAGSMARAGGEAALPARRRHADRARDRGRDRRLQPLRIGRGVHRLRRARAPEHSSGERRSQGSITKVCNAHVRRLLVEAARHARRRPTVGYELARRQRGQEARRACLALPTAPLPTLAADGRPRQAVAEDRRRLRPRARRLRLGIATEQPLTSA